MGVPTYNPWADVLSYVILFGINSIIGAIAVHMSKKRGLRAVPAFFAAFFTSFVALFYISMHPVKEDVSDNTKL